MVFWVFVGKIVSKTELLVTYVQSNYASSQKMLIYFDVVYKKREHTMSHSLLSHLCACAYFAEIVNVY